MKTRDTNDKILDNKFNTGEVEYQHLDSPSINNNYLDRIEDLRNSHEYFRKNELDEELYGYWKESKWFDIYKRRNKRIPKDQLPEIYIFLKKHIKDDSYTSIELISGIAEFLNVNYESLCQSIPMNDKLELIKELDEKYNIIKKKKIVKLF